MTKEQYNNLKELVEVSKRQMNDDNSKRLRGLISEYQELSKTPTKDGMDEYIKKNSK